MQNPHDQRVRNALWQLTAVRPSDGQAEMPSLLFLRTPSIVCLWMASLLAIAGIAMLGRIRIPRIIRGAAVAVRAETGSTALLLLLPASARAYVHPGQRAELDSGGISPVVLEILAVDSTLLDATTARTRFANPGSLIVQLDVPKLVVHLSECSPARCLTPSVGETYPVTTRTGTRSLASYALAGS